MRILRQRTYNTVITYMLIFPRLSVKGGSFAFDCDREGKVDLAELSTRPHAFANYQNCLLRKDVGKPEIQEFQNTDIQPAIGECNACGKEVYLHGFTNTCECGVDYNSAGQQLAHRSQWGEETGESLSDILSIR